MTTPLPVYPWHTVGTNLFEIDGTHYMLTVVLLISRGEEVVYNYISYCDYSTARGLCKTRNIREGSE
jgi:hypothetical protein